jgi:hypothetical protein
MLLSALLMAAAASAIPTRDMPVLNPLQQEAQCPETPMSVARKMGQRPPNAIPLNRLPPAMAFMAVDRRIGGCPAPLTASEYRRASRRR